MVDDDDIDGDDALNDGPSSFAIIDMLVQYVHDHVDKYPLVNRIVVAGHSAGGQVVGRFVILSVRCNVQMDSIYVVGHVIITWSTYHHPMCC